MKYKLLFSIILIFIFGCKPADKKIRPGIFLTFDDRNMLHWEKQIPLFEKYNARVTFFVECFDKLTTEQLDALKKLRKAGHGHRLPWTKAS